jgi:tripartite-type tricarboxylate transporter receptor subunit TctC
MTCGRTALCHLAGAVLAASACLLPSDAPAWPDRVVRILTGPAGSSGDAGARTLADGLSDRWKQPVIVENRAGADHILAAQASAVAGA